MYFIEHGLDRTEIEDILSFVRKTTQDYAIDCGWWDSCNLPLVILATEAGYRYKGSGTDFWPLLESELGFEISPQQRQYIRSTFVDASKQFRGATPPDSPWTNAFHLIAWPITHALLPLEFHAPFATALTRLRLRVSGLDNDTLYSAIRSVSWHPSSRFDVFLRNGPLVVALARNLLEGANLDLSPEVVARISTDLSDDAVARRDIAVARSIQRSLHRPEVALPVRIPVIKTVAGRLQLRKLDGKLYLEASFPSVDFPILERLRRELRRQRYAPRLWGLTERIPAEQLLSGLPFVVRLSTETPSPNAALLPDLGEIDLEDDLRSILAGFSLDFIPPSLFAVSSDEDVAPQIAGPDISGHRHYWLLCSNNAVARLSEFKNVGSIGSLQCFQVDPNTELGSLTLQRLGFRVRFGISVSIAGSAPLNGYASIPEFVIGDRCAIVPRRTLSERTVVSLEGDELELSDTPISFVVTRGEHSLEVHNKSEARTYEFRGTDAANHASPPTVWIDLLGAELTVQSLLAGSLALRIDSLSPLDGLELKLELECQKTRIGVLTTLAPLPQLLAATDEPWPTLLDDATRSLLLQDPNPKLTITVGLMASKTVQLEQRVRSCWWVQNGSDFSLQSEFGPLPYGAVYLAGPTSPPSSAIDDDEEVKLLSPIAINPETYGPAAEFTSICLAPRRIRLDISPINKPRLGRQQRSGHDVIGLEDLTKAYLRWALAESANLTSELRRKQVLVRLNNWMAELCCGGEWARRELEYSSATSDPWQLLLESCLASGVGTDPNVELSETDSIEVCRLAVIEIRRVRPDLWARFEDLCDEDFEAIDLACGRAYAQLAEGYKTRGRVAEAEIISEGDPGTTDDIWRATLEGVRSSSNLSALGELLIPTDQASGLVSIDFSLMSFEDLRAELVRWAHRAKRALAGPVPSDGILEAILALWVSPSKAVTLDWKGGLNTLLAERCISCASRYMALRWRQTRQRGIS